MKLLLAGFVLSLMGSLPPGLISLSVAYTVISRGLVAALVLASGAAFAEFFQAWLAVALSDWFFSHPIVEKLFGWIAVIVFLSLSLYLVFWAGAPEVSKRAIPANKGWQFSRGLMLSTFNLLAVPYWFVYCAWLRMEGWWEDGPISLIFFCCGVMFGTFSALSLYAWLGMFMVQRAGRIARQANRLVGLIFLGLGLKLLWGLLC